MFQRLWQVKSLNCAGAFNCRFITRFCRKGRELELGINAECALGIQRLQEEVLSKKAIIGKLNASAEL